MQVILTPTHLGIVMDVAPGGTLRAHMKRQPGCRLPEDSARWFFQQLIIGMDYCHKMVRGQYIQVNCLHFHLVILRGSILRRDDTQY